MSLSNLTLNDYLGWTCSVGSSVPIAEPACRKKIDESELLFGANCCEMGRLSVGGGVSVTQMLKREETEEPEPCAVTVISG